jgi:acetoacetate decarboxylase
VTAAYPPEPWALRGQLHTSVFLVPLLDVPVDLPPGCTPVRVGRFGVVGTAWVSYEPGGVLSYREVMATLLVRRGWRLLPTIVRIWVDSEASRDGGRALWGIPKELADFDFAGERFGARDDRGPLARGTVRPRLRLPGRWPVRFCVVQWREGAAKISPVRARAGLSVDSGSLDADPAGPLGFLAGRRPLLSATLRDFEMSFGAARV